MSNEIPGLAQDRLKRSIAAFIRELEPSRDYMRPHLYQIAAWDDDAQMADLVPSAVTSGMPTISKCAWRGLGKVTLPVGLECVVWFDNGDPTRPFIGTVGQFSSAGSQADGIDMSQDDDSVPFPLPSDPRLARRVVRYGDIITFPTPTGLQDLPVVAGGGVPPSPTVSVSKVKA